MNYLERAIGGEEREVGRRSELRSKEKKRKLYGWLEGLVLWCVKEVGRRGRGAVMSIATNPLLCFQAMPVITCIILKLLLAAELCTSLNMIPGRCCAMLPSLIH